MQESKIPKLMTWILWGDTREWIDPAFGQPRLSANQIIEMEANQKAFQRNVAELFKLINKKRNYENIKSNNDIRK